MTYLNPEDIANRVVFAGVTYIQLRGRDRSLWWPENARGFSDGHASDTDELPALRRKVKDLIKERDKAEGEYRRAVGKPGADIGDLNRDRERWQSEYQAFIADAQRDVDLHQKLKDASAGYGARTWFG